METLTEDHLIGYNGSPRLIHKHSQIEGEGLFTKDPINKEEFILRLKGNLIYHQYNPAFSKEGVNWIGIGYQKWVAPWPGDSSLYINHCCEPNVVINTDHVLIALNEIKAGDELLLDYSSTELDPYWQMKCNCGSFNCRKTIKSFQFLPHYIQQKYIKYLHPDFSSIYNR